jgi:hypothetical protein
MEELQVLLEFGYNAKEPFLIEAKLSKESASLSLKKMGAAVKQMQNRNKKT